MRVTQPFDASTLPFGRELKAEWLSIDPELVERLVEWQMGVFPQPQ
jgi:hypothetical protein